MPNSSITRMPVLSLIGGLVVLINSTSLPAATFNVTNAVQLQVALTVSAGNNEDDTIHISAGTHNVASTLIYHTDDGDGGHELSIIGAGADATILDGGNLVQILDINTNTTLDGGDAGSQVSIRGIDFQDGYSSTDDGGGLSIFTYNGAITLDELDFDNNSTDHRGGVFVGSGAGSITVTNCTFSENSASSGEGGGAFIGSETGSVFLANNTFTANTAATGGGAWIFSHTGQITLTTNTFSGNVANTGTGGGAYVLAYNAQLSNNVFSGNAANVGTGGGVYVLADSAQLSNSLFRSNSATGSGGGATIASRDSYVSANLFISNMATDFGGGIVVEAIEGTTLVNNVLTNNQANIGGGGLFLAGDSVDLINNTYYSNAATVTGGGFVSVVQGNSSLIDIYNNIIWGNSAPAGSDFSIGADGDNDGTGAAVNLFNNDFSNFDIDVANNLSQGSNIDQDPLLTPDGHLQGGSPAIDVGLNSAPGLPGSDFEGEPRIMNSVVDMGADEFPGPVVFPTAVPTLSWWGMILLGLLLGAGALAKIGRR